MKDRLDGETEEPELDAFRAHDSSLLPVHASLQSANGTLHSPLRIFPLPSDSSCCETLSKQPNPVLL